MKPRLCEINRGANRFRCRSEATLRGYKGWLSGYGGTAKQAHSNWVRRVAEFEDQKRIGAQRLKNLQRFDQHVPDDQLIGVGPVKKLIAAIKARIYGEAK